MTYQTKVTGPKKHGLKKKPDSPGFNQSFFTTPNILWYYYAVNWLPHKNKPLICLPCASAKKTRAKYGKKMFSHSTTHQFLSAITRCEDFEKVVISEPLTIVPYALEGQHPDYNVPTEDLTIQDEVAFNIRLANWLNIVKRKQPKRKYIYYIGGTHHYFVLKQTLEKARKPFKLIYEIPEGGVKGYASAAKSFKEVVMNLENKNIKPKLKPVSLEKFLNSRGRYTNRKYWEYIKVIKKISLSKKNPVFQSEKMPVAKKSQCSEGFSELYATNVIQRMKEGEVY